MLGKFREGIVPDTAAGTGLDESGAAAVESYAAAMDALGLRDGAEAAWGLVSAANLFIQQTAPWALAKQGKDAELDAVLAALARCLVRLAVMTSPFIPLKAQVLWTALGQPGEVSRAAWTRAVTPAAAGARTQKPDGLFPKPAEV